MAYTVDHRTISGVGPLKVIVCGGRDFNDAGFVNATLDRFNDLHGIESVVEGGATGADRLAAEWARGNGKTVITHNADWRIHGKMAGPIRNQKMLDVEQPDAVIAFPGGKGTANMAKIADKAGVQVWRAIPNEGGGESD